MKPHLVGTACHRLQQALDEALAEGSLHLPPELATHAARCPRCGPDVRDTEALFARLRGAPSGLGLGRVPGVVDFVVAKTAAEPAPKPATRPTVGARKRADLRWAVGQVAAAAAVLCITVGGFSYAVLKLNEAVSGTRPAEVVERMVAPFKNFTQALFKDAR